MAENYYQNLAVKRLSGEASTKEIKILDKWLNASAENQGIYQNLQKVWEKPVQPELPYQLNLDNAWQKFESVLKDEPVNVADKISLFERIQSLTKNFFDIKFRPAFAAFAVLVLIILSWTFWSKYPDTTQQLIIKTLNKETTSYTFSDGSTVRLNYGSFIKFDKVFSDIREVYLSGEAFFSVTKSNKPFVVLTDHAKTTVLGTEFDVWARHGKTRVAVKQGKVKVGALTSQTSEVALLPGEMSVVTQNSEPSPIESVDPERMLGWLDGKLVFERMPLEEITYELERAYDIKIRIKTPGLEKRALTAVFEKSDIDTVLASICLALNANYEFKTGIYIIFEM